MSYPRVISNDDWGPLLSFEIRFGSDAQAERVVNEIDVSADTVTLAWTNASIRMAPEEWRRVTDIRGPGGVVPWPKKKRRKRR